jgi:hypothetical protein
MIKVVKKINNNKYFDTEGVSAKTICNRAFIPRSSVLEDALHFLAALRVLGIWGSPGPPLVGADPTTRTHRLRAPPSQTTAVAASPRLCSASRGSTELRRGWCHDPASADPIEGEGPMPPAPGRTAQMWRWRPPLPCSNRPHQRHRRSGKPPPKVRRRVTEVGSRPRRRKR